MDLASPQGVPFVGGKRVTREETLDFHARTQVYGIMLRNVPNTVALSDVRSLLVKFGGIEFMKAYPDGDALQAVRAGFYSRHSMQRAIAALHGALPWGGSTKVMCVGDKLTRKAAVRGDVLTASKSVGLLNSEFPLLWSNTIDLECTAAHPRKRARTTPTVSAREVGLWCVQSAVLAGMDPDALDGVDSPDTIPADSESEGEGTGFGPGGGDEGCDGLGLAGTWAVNAIGACSAAMAPASQDPTVNPHTPGVVSLRQKPFPRVGPASTLCARATVRIEFHTSQAWVPEGTSVVGMGGCPCQPSSGTLERTFAHGSSTGGGGAPVSAYSEDTYHGQPERVHPLDQHAYTLGGEGGDEQHFARDAPERSSSGGSGGGVGTAYHPFCASVYATSRQGASSSVPQLGSGTSGVGTGSDASAAVAPPSIAAWNDVTGMERSQIEVGMHVKTAVASAIQAACSHLHIAVPERPLLIAHV